MAAVVALAACGCGGSGGHPPPPPPPPPAPVTQMISVAAAGTISGLGGHYADDISLVLTRL